ncbi:hypothetical protein NEUTE1DRAFT_100964 [Neurospora tetrasperma FGSC 2508]|uniref:Uncharacterized protein n=1 Tax=Neurospora tetrasperma (strain FGSC 2508 / ATCC MYA-4615 / P0657) TaxID=510951 RepID=F8MNB9_NEUT8|nr:uncharacterized protein NEUTE1DRAFT_100964 [Neurospora tetrasperma FGSC 2508]EGO58089.1 hypothetical protein NEUTE1DRAFT_100964 [Neurospora tetrasperma FGSC 2508]
MRRSQRYHTKSGLAPNGWSLPGSFARWHHGQDKGDQLRKGTGKAGERTIGKGRRGKPERARKRRRTNHANSISGSP